MKDDILIKSEDIDVKFCQVQNKYYLYDKKSMFHYWHDVLVDDPNEITDVMIKEFLNTRNRRYQRLSSVLESIHPILFISVQHSSCQFKKENRIELVQELFNSLSKRHPNCTMIAINYCNKTFISNNFHHYYIESEWNDITEDKPFFQNKLISFIQGNIKNMTITSSRSIEKRDRKSVV